MQMAINSPSSLGFTALRSMIIEGRLSVVTAIMGQDRTELRALGEQGLRHRDRTENVRIHRDAHQHGQDNAEGIAAAQNGLNP